MSFFIIWRVNSSFIVNNRHLTSQHRYNRAARLCGELKPAHRWRWFLFLSAKMNWSCLFGLSWLIVLLCDEIKNNRNRRRFVTWIKKTKERGKRRNITETGVQQNWMERNVSKILHKGWNCNKSESCGDEIKTMRVISKFWTSLCFKFLCSLTNYTAKMEI